MKSLSNTSDSSQYLIQKTYIMKLRHLLIFLLFSVFSSAQSVVDIVVNSENHNTLEAAVIAAGLDATLSGDGPFTLFAPTDDAFNALPEGTVDALLEDPSGALTDILLYHAVGTEAFAADLTDGQMITTINGKDITVTINMDGVFINDAQVTMADIDADNGVVHVIDAVLLPPSNTVVDIVVNSENHNTLEAAVIAAGLDATLSGDGPFTLFAPTDDAFSALPEGTVDALLEDPSGALTDILLYHAVGAEAFAADLTDGQMITTINGKDITVTINMDGVFINDAQVTMADIDADNGVVHVIDAVLLPPPPTVFDIISDSPDHNTLQSLIEAASLDGVLSDEGTYTVFAPTDEAFSILPQEVIDQLLADPSGQLTDILTYHVTGSVIGSGDLEDRTIATALNGLDYLVTEIEGGGFTINANGSAGAQITVTDLEGTNGVVHVIDAILIPSTNASIIFNSQDFSILTQLLQATGLIDAQNTTEDRTTLFAPTNNAFIAVPEDILLSIANTPQELTDALLYHVSEGRTFASDLSDQLEITTAQGETAIITLNADGAFINDAQITVTDFFTGNGIIHVIDAVLLPEPTTVMDVIIRSEDHTVLQIALDTANLSETLQGEGTFTVFAPTDAAFGEIPAETLLALLSQPEGDLTQILLYHVIGSEVLSTDLSDGLTATTLNGSDITVSIDGDNNVFINSAQVTAADIVTENGIVHVIDMVLLPPVGTTELPSSEANVYPNPASHMITVDYENNQLENPTIYILDNNGRAIRNIKNVKPGQSIDVADLQNGIYNVIISDDQFSISKRITKID